MISKQRLLYQFSFRNSKSLTVPSEDGHSSETADDGNPANGTGVRADDQVSAAKKTTTATEGPKHQVELVVDRSDLTGESEEVLRYV